MKNPINSYLDYTYVNSEYLQFLPNLDGNGHYAHGFAEASLDADFIISLGINPFKESEMTAFLGFLDDNCISLLDNNTDVTQANVRLAYEAFNSDDQPCHNIDEAIFNA
jgi:hypothetical protein